MVTTGLLLGAALGFVMQRGRFCVTGAFREVWVSRRTRWLTAFFIVVAIQSAGVFALQSAGVLTLPQSNLPLAGVLIGSLLFGLGIVLAGGCATGTYYRAGEGLVGSWIALGMYALLAATMKDGALSGANEGLRNETVPVTTIYDSLGVSPWLLIALLLAGTGYAAWRQLAKRRTVATLPARHAGLRHLLFEKAWHPFATAVVISVIAIAAYPLSFATGRESGLGITTPSADLVSFLVTGDGETGWNWGVMLILGILVGSYFAAKGSGEFKVRVPDARTTVRSLAGGSLMGIGAAWAGGCTIGNAMVQTAQFSYQGWLALVFIFLGVGLGVRLFITPHRRAGALHTAPVTATPGVPAGGAAGLEAAALGTEGADGPATPPQPAKV